MGSEGREVSQLLSGSFVVSLFLDLCYKSLIVFNLTILHNLCPSYLKLGKLFQEQEPLDNTYAEKWSIDIKYII